MVDLTARKNAWPEQSSPDEIRDQCRVIEHLTTCDPACRCAHSGYLLIAFAQRRKSTPAPPKSLKLFGIVHHLGLVHTPRQPPSRFILPRPPTAHAMSVEKWKT
jgi:hypothetical protein